MSTSRSARTVLVLSLACLGIVPGCSPKANLPIVVNTEHDETLRDYVNGHIDNPELFPHERARLERKEELLLNWATRQSMDNRGAKVRIVAPPLQLTGDPNLDRTHTYEIILVADQLPEGKTFLDEYDVVVAPEQLLATVRPAVSANSLYDTDLLYAQETRDRLKMDLAEVKSEKAAADSFIATSKGRIDEALATAKKNLAAYQTEQADAATALSQHENVRLLFVAFNRKEAAARAENTLTQARKAVASNTTEIDDATAAAAALPTADDAKTQTDTARSAKNTAQTVLDTANAMPSSSADEQQAKAKAVTEATTALEKAKADLADAVATQANVKKAAERLRKANQAKGPLAAAVTTAEADAKAAATASEAADKAAADGGFPEGKISTYALDFSRARRRAEMAGERVAAAERDVNRLGTLLDSANAKAASTEQLKTLVDFYDADYDRLKSLAENAPGGGQYSSHRAVSVRLRGQALANVESVRIEAVRKNALVPTEAEQRKSKRTLTWSGNAVQGVSDTAGRSTADDPKALPDILNALASRLTDTRKVLRMNRDAIHVQSQVDWLAHVTADLAPLRGRARAAVLSLPPSSAIKVAEKLNAVNPSSYQREGDTNGALARKVLDTELVKAFESLQSVQPTTEQLRDAVWTAKTAAILDAARERVALLQQAFDAADPDSEISRTARVVQLITDGDLSVFRLNVLRGVVKTTGYLLANDGSVLLFGKKFSERFYVVQVTLSNPQDKPILIYGNTMRFIVRMDSRDPNERNEDGQPISRTWWATVQPLNYDAVQRMVTQIGEESWQKNVLKVMELTGIGAGVATVFSDSLDLAKSAAAFSGVVTPAVRELLEADLKRYQENFKGTGLAPIEEIPANGVLTRYVFLPKGPIFGAYTFDIAKASRLSAEASHVPGFDSDDFSKRALVPSYIHDIRREEVLVEGKRILASDPLTSQAGK